MKPVAFPQAPVYVQEWPEGTALCKTCGQPDNCGDCKHGALTVGQIVDLGGVLVPASVVRIGER